MRPQGLVHRFPESLALSESYSEAPWWEEVYREAFPDFLSMQCIRKAGWGQMAGIDRIVILKSGATIYVDEKVRGEDYTDIALERWSDKDRRKPGWIQKDLACNYIAYAFIPSSTCYLLPFQQLRKAWKLYGRRWIEKAEAEEAAGIPLKDREYPFIRARNPTYVTESVGVPINTLLDALLDALTIRWRRGTPA